MTPASRSRGMRQKQPELMRKKMEMKLNGGRCRRNPIKVDLCSKKGAGRWMKADGGRWVDTDGESAADRNRRRWMRRLHKNRNNGTKRVRLLID